MGTIALMVVVNVALLALFRFGVNQRFKDPSMTRAQVVIAILVLMAFIYAMDKGALAGPDPVPDRADVRRFPLQHSRVPLDGGAGARGLRRGH